LVDDPLRDKHRHRSSIIAKVLERAIEGTIKTHIMYEASLSYVQLIRYLSFLLDRNLLEVVKTPKKTIYKTTDKGLRYLRHYRKTMELLKDGKGNNAKEANSLHLIESGSRVIIEK